MPDQPENQNPDGGGTHAPAAEAKAAAADSASSKIKFTPEQQEIVNELIDRMFGKGFEKGKSLAQQELDARVAEVKAENEKLAKQLASFKTPPADEAVAPTKATKAEKAAERSAEPSPEIQQLLARFDEMQSVASTLKQERDTLSKQLLEAKERSRKTLIKEAFITASKDISFFDPMEVYTLIENQIDVDESDQVVITNPRTRQPRLNSNMEPMTLAEYLAEFATQKPYLVRASNRDGGTGAGGSRRVDSSTSSPSSKTDINAMTNEEFEAYRNSILASRYR